MEGIELARIFGGDRHAPVVYFLRVGGIVKIGTTTQLSARVSQLGLTLRHAVYVMPGGRDTERAMHERFAAQRLRDRSEWFTYAGALAGFLAEHAARPERPEPEPEDIPDGAIGLREACATGVLTISIENARRARNRDPRFPPAVSRGSQTEMLYDTESLIRWQHARKRGGYARLGEAG